MKKLLAVLLSIMMLAMPLTSMAENSVWDNAARQETTITIHDLNADLVAALGGLTATAAVEHDCCHQRPAGGAVPDRLSAGRRSWL